MRELTHDLIARAGVPAGRDAPSPSSDEARLRAEMRVFLGERRPVRGIWIFAYGSLMWQRDKAAADIVAPARLPGFARRYTLWDLYDRGTPAVPALTLGLESAPGPGCPGMLLHLPGPQVEDRLWPIWQQETAPGFYDPGWHDATLHPGGAPVRALAFTARHASPLHAGDLPVGTVADVLSRAAGPNGPAAAYLLDAVEELRRHDLRDPMLDMMAAEVARRLASR